MPCFIFDRDLNVLKAPPGETWPVAIVRSLRTHVRAALLEGRSSFAPAGIEPQWHVLALADGGPERIAVYTERTFPAEAEHA